MTVIYLVLLLLAVFYSIRWDGVEAHDNAYKNHRYWLLCILLILITGFSYGLGGDKFVYMNQFDSIPEDVSIGEYTSLAVVILGNMPLWTLLTLFAKKCFDSFYAIQIIQAIITNVVYFYVASKYTHRKFCFVIVYFLTLTYFIFNAEIMREGIAIAIAMIGMEAYMEGKKKVFAACYALAILFHVSAIIVILFPFFRVKVSIKNLGISIAASFAIWFLSDLFIAKVLSALIGSTGALASKITHYSAVATNFNGYLGSVIQYMILPYIIMYYSYLWEENDEIKKKKEKLISFHILLALCASSLAGFTRFRNYIEIYYLIMLGDFVYTMLFLLWQKHFLYYSENQVYFYQRYIPYRCILNESKDVLFREDVHQESVKETVSDEASRNIE